VTIAVYLPLLLPLLVSAIARWAADRVRPGAAVRGLVAAAVAGAALSVWSLTLLTLTLFDDLPRFHAPAGTDFPEPVPDAVGLFALAALAGGAVRLTLDLRHRADAVRRLRAPGRPENGLVVADWAAPLAVAVPGRPGHVLVTSGMLRLLGAPERRAVLAHERAHLRHRHHLAVSAVAAAAAVNPLLRPVRETVTYLVERWADEEAATTVGDRGLVARAVARAALATVPAALGGLGAPGGLGVHGGVIVRRVGALGRPPVGKARRLLTASAVTIALCLLAGGHATRDFVELLRLWLA
jgi:Zn-dependent protease with chaperone function